MEREHRAQIEVEDGIAVGDHECLGAEEIAQPVQRTAGAEQYWFGSVGDAHSQRDPSPSPR